MDVLRARIDQVDKMMLTLFEERMSLVKEIAVYKNTHQIKVEDTDRERAMKETLATYLKNEDLVYYYLTFLENILEISKVYQKEFVTQEA
ncbi:MAG: chorismate mutase [Eubacteriaceae bacterium]|jgi:monofunctional chorismate mutase|nr:chorismate mutase [Eubacteriaceae bacterium]